MDKLSDTQLIALIGPIVAVQLVLIVTAFIALAKAERTRGPKWVWAIVILLGNLLGPIVFFLFGRRSV